MAVIYNLISLIEIIMGTIFLAGFSVSRLFFFQDWTLQSEIIYFLAWLCVYGIHYLALWKGQGVIHARILKIIRIWEFVVFLVLAFGELVLYIVVYVSTRHHFSVGNFVQWQSLLLLVITIFIIRHKTRHWFDSVS